MSKEELLTLAIVIGVVGGYIANVVKLVLMLGAPASEMAMFLCRLIGIFVPPLGIVFGYL